MRNGTLECEKLACDVYTSRIQSAGMIVLKAEMIIAMRTLCLSAGFYDVDLCCYAIARTEPGSADVCEPGVGVVRYKGRRVEEGVFGEGVPDARVCAGCGGEVVSPSSSLDLCLSFEVDNLSKGLCGCGDGFFLVGVVHPP